MVNNATLCLHNEGSLYSIQCTHSISLEEILQSEDCLKKGDALTPLIFNFALEYAIRRVHAHQDSFILSGTHQLIVNADNVNVLGGNVNTLYKEKHRKL